ncbi:hypothetical protein CALVIDRAFT_93143 [Calocera viscosa TUFC12733]|uniref:Uncharacterized protein n=1 Tax=Calocera viscosa (strain TUFC12733) TaxID=1330018 RepID=A0A167MVE3_CALVF|nr:hypothetical protein CALVIDRAFT_93143 [Calocera viscosa TUFC12733]
MVSRLHGRRAFAFQLFSMVKCVHTAENIDRSAVGPPLIRARPAAVKRHTVYTDDESQKLISTTDRIQYPIQSICYPSALPSPSRAISHTTSPSAQNAPSVLSFRQKERSRKENAKSPEIMRTVTEFVAQERM